MISAIGNHRHRPAGREFGRIAALAGFSLIEILLVLGLMGLLCGLFISAGSGLFGDATRRGAGAFWDVVRHARHQAIMTDSTVILQVSEDATQLVLQGTAGRQVVGLTAGMTIMLLCPEERTTILLGGELVETKSLALVRFYPDGTCDAFRAQMTVPAKPRQVVTVDPWTCAQMSDARGLPRV